MRQEELKSLVEEMTLEEKINQLFQAAGNLFAEDVVVTGPMEEMGITKENINQAGSAIGVFGASQVMKLQDMYLKGNKRKIPLLMMLDVINGFRTVFPIPLAQGCTFNPELSKECAAIAAKEAAYSGVHVTFAPMVDLVRDARWGRVMESTGEDPYLNSLFAKAMVEGFQGTDVGEEGRVAACVKHFAAYGAPDGGRDYNNVELSERTLREDYLPAYQAAIDAGSKLVMTSFNTLNRIPATGNKKLMRDILRGEMGFDGVLISDWQAIQEIIYHGYANGKKEAARLSLEAGVDIDMMSTVYTSSLKALTEEGAIEEGRIDEAVFRILQLKNDLGLFENPYKDASPEKEKAFVLCSANREMARRAARESFVLLKNEDILPLNSKKRVAFIGPYASASSMNGAWSFIGREEDTISIEKAIRKRYPEMEAVFAKGCPMIDPDLVLQGFGDAVKEDIKKEEIPTYMEEAAELAGKAEIVVLALGEHRIQSGEAASRGEITVPDVQMELLEKIYEVNKNIVVVLFSGRPLDIRTLSQKARAVLEVWMPGTEGGNAIVDILMGEYGPSGKLSMCFPYSVAQLPMHYDEFSTGRPHVPGKDKDRFRSKYLDLPNSPLYPFGYGLSYTEFTFGGVSLDKRVLVKGKKDVLKASVFVKNTGEREDTETVQLYIQDVFASAVRPVRQLKGFEKITLMPGEERKVTFEIKEEMLRFFQGDMSFDCEEGEFRVWIGADCTATNMESFELIL